MASPSKYLVLSSGGKYPHRRGRVCRNTTSRQLGSRGLTKAAGASRTTPSETTTPKSSNNLHPDRGYGDDEDEDGDGGVDAAADDGDDDETYLAPRPATRGCRLCDDMCSQDQLPSPGKLCLLTEVRR